MSDVMTEDGLPVDESTPDPVAVEPEVQPEPEQWQLSRDEWEQTQATLQQIAQRPVYEPQYQEPVQVEPDYTRYADPVTGEFTPQGIQQWIRDEASQMLDARLASVEPVLNQTVADRGEAIIQQKFAELKQSVGDFDEGFARELAEGYAATGQDPTTAIQKAAQRAHEFAQTQRQAGVDEYKTTLQNIGQAPREPGADGAGVPDGSQPPPDFKGDKYKWIADNWAARHGLPQ